MTFLRHRLPYKDEISVKIGCGGGLATTFFVMIRYALLIAIVLAAVIAPLSGEPELISLGPFGGDVRSLACHPQRPNWIFLGTADGQLFLSKSSGKRWEKLSPGLNRRELVIDSLVFHPNQPDILYAGGWELRSDRGELFVTKDGGVTWGKVDLGRYQSSIRAVALAPSNPDYIAVGITEGVIVSRDGGREWTRISRGYRSLYNVHSLAFHPSDANLLFAGTWRLGWRTPNLGKRWIRIQNGIYWDSHLFSIRINPENPEIVFAGACSGIYRSTNGGDQWTRLRSGLPSEAKRTRTLRFDPKDPKTIYAGTTAGLYRSVNNGADWKQLLKDVVVNTILIDPNDSQTVMLGTDDAGVLKSTDAGHSFLPANEGFTQRQVGAVAVQPGTKDVFYAGVALDRQFGGFFLSRDRGRTWASFNKGLGKVVPNIHTILPLDSPELVFLGTSGGLFRGVPEKEEWSLVGGTSGLTINNLDIHRGQKLLFLACPDGMYQLDLSEERLTRQVLAADDPKVTSVLVDRERNLVYAGTSRGVYRSRDQGASWQIKSKGLSGASIETLEKAGPNILCGTKSGLFFSNDNGESWSPSGGVFPIEIGSIRANPSSQEQVVAANVLSGYFFVSVNGGLSWEVTDLGPSLSKISSLAFTSSGDLLAGTVTEGVFQIVTGFETNQLATLTTTGPSN